MQIKVGDVGTCRARNPGNQATLTYSVVKSARGTISVLVEGEDVDEKMSAVDFERDYEPGLGLDELLEICRNLPPPTPEERRRQAISFAYGNVRMSNPDVTIEMVEAAFDKLHPNGYPPPDAKPPTPGQKPAINIITDPNPPAPAEQPDYDSLPTDRPGMASIGRNPPSLRDIKRST